MRLMKVTKYMSNSSEVLNSIPKDDLGPLMENDEPDEKEIRSANTKILGINYDPVQDSFHFSSYAKLLEKEPIFTKRGISSLIPSIFDVNGLISPYILRGKIILSRVWAYEKPEPGPDPAYTNNEEKSYESPTPNIEHESSPEKCDDPPASSDTLTDMSINDPQPDGGTSTGMNDNTPEDPSPITGIVTNDNVPAINNKVNVESDDSHDSPGAIFHPMIRRIIFLWKASIDPS